MTMARSVDGCVDPVREGRQDELTAVCVSVFSWTGAYPHLL